MKPIEEQRLYGVVRQYKHLQLNEKGIVSIKNDKYLLEFCDLIQQYLKGTINKIVAMLRELPE